MDRESLLANIYITKALLLMMEHSADTSDEAKISELFQDLREQVLVMETAIQE